MHHHHRQPFLHWGFKEVNVLFMPKADGITTTVPVKLTHAHSKIGINVKTKLVLWRNFLWVLDIYIYVCVCVSKEMSWIRQNVRRKDKTEKRYMFDGSLICQRVSTSIFFFWMQKYFIKIILEWEITMIDRFWFNWKSSSGFVNLAMWKNGVILVDMFKLYHVMRWNFFFFFFFET